MVGAKKFTKTDYIDSLDVNYMIELDRKGFTDAVFYNCTNEKFIKFVCDATGNTKSWGTYSDISTLMPASGLCGVNLSCGYFKAHTKEEYVDYDTMMETIIITKHLIETKCDEPFIYETYAYGGGNYDYNYDWYDEWDNNGWAASTNDDNKKQSNIQKTKDIPTRISKDTYLELEVLTYGTDGRERVLYAFGTTKAECWIELLTTNPEICLNDIIDYSFM
jgi:hypothetical protein